MSAIGGKSGRHLLRLRSSQFDPERPSRYSPHERYRPQEWKLTIVPQLPFCAAMLWRRSRNEVRMTSKSWIRWLGAPLIALVLTTAPSVSPVHAVEDARKVSVVSFGLFGDQGVF